MKNAGRHKVKPDRTKTVLQADGDILNVSKINKTRITINLDQDIVEYFKHRGAETAKGYQTLINDALRNYIGLGSTTDLVTSLVERINRLEKKLRS
jgi:uncharacterized protein (DUF4415 family)